MTYEDVLSFCEEQDVRFIRLSYFDMYGHQKMFLFCQPN